MLAIPTTYRGLLVDEGYRKSVTEAPVASLDSQQGVKNTLAINTLPLIAPLPNNRYTVGKRRGRAGEELGLAVLWRKDNELIPWFSSSLNSKAGCFYAFSSAAKFIHVLTSITFCPL